MVLGKEAPKLSESPITDGVNPAFISPKPKSRGVLVCTSIANALEPEAASAGARQEIGKNQRCSHRTFPMTATEAPSAQVRLGELCGHRQRWWPLRPLHP